MKLDLFSQLTLWPSTAKATPLLIKELYNVPIAQMKNYVSDNTVTMFYFNLKSKVELKNKLIFRPELN